MSKVYLASDHGGFTLKEHIKGLLNNHQVEDLGPFSEDSVDYPVFANKLALAVLTNGGVGIGICGTGIGISMALNRHAGIRAALCHSVETAKLTREHNDSNVLCLGGRVLSKELASEIVTAWLATEFSKAERHSRRIAMLDVS